MTMGVLRAVTMGLTSLLLSLLVLTEPSEEQVAWRPQGRFGKRTSYQDIVTDRIRDLGKQLELIHMLDVPSFEKDGILCIASTDLKGLYRCFTVNPDESSPNPLTLLSSPIVEIDGVWCVSAGDRGSYRCFKFAEDDAQNSLLNH